MINASWHRAHVMPKDATPKQRLAWHLQHQKNCGCRELTEAQRLKLVEAARKERYEAAMIDHLSLPVSDVDATARVYSAALAPLGYSVLMAFTQEQMPQLPYSKTAGLGAKGKPDLWLRTARGPVDGTHVALAVSDRKDVDAFHAAALAAGLTDDGKPGLREHYHPHYYAAFVRDADGHSLEVVCHASPAVKKVAAKSVAAKKKPAAKKSAAKKKKR